MLINELADFGLTKRLLGFGHVFFLSLLKLTKDQVS